MGTRVGKNGGSGKADPPTWFRRLWDELVGLAEAQNAELVDLTSTETELTRVGESEWRLTPRKPGAMALSLFVSDAYSTYLGVGVGGWIEIFTFPKRPTRAVPDILEVVRAVVEGRMKETTWTRRDGSLANSLLRWQLVEGGRWRRIGEISQPLFRRRFKEVTTHFAPYV